MGELQPVDSGLSVPYLGSTPRTHEEARDGKVWEGVKK